MALKFRLRGLAETFIEQIACPCCSNVGSDDQNFITEMTRVTLEGIVVVVQCRACGEIFVPDSQRLGIINPKELKLAVERDSIEAGEPLFPGLASVRLNVEKLNAQRKGDWH